MGRLLTKVEFCQVLSNLTNLSNSALNENLAGDSSKEISPEPSSSISVSIALSLSRCFGVFGACGPNSISACEPYSEPIRLRIREIPRNVSSLFSVANRKIEGCGGRRDGAGGARRPKMTGAENPPPSNFRRLVLGCIEAKFCK